MVKDRVAELRILLEGRRPVAHSLNVERVIRLLDEEVKGVYLEQRRIGWTYWATAVAISALLWLLLSEIEGSADSGQLSIHAIGVQLVFLFLVGDATYFLYLSILPQRIDILSEERFETNADRRRVLVSYVFMTIRYLVLLSLVIITWAK